MLLQVLIISIVPSIFVFNRMQSLSDRIFGHRYSSRIVAAAAIVVVPGLRFGGSEVQIAALLALCVVFQLVLYRWASESFRRNHGRAPQSAFGEFDYSRMAADAPDRWFSAVFTLAANVVPIFFVGLALK